MDTYRKIEMYRGYKLEIKAHRSSGRDRRFIRVFGPDGYCEYGVYRTITKAHMFIDSLIAGAGVEPTTPSL